MANSLGQFHGQNSFRTVSITVLGAIVGINLEKISGIFLVDKK